MTGRVSGGSRRLPQALSIDDVFVDGRLQGLVRSARRNQIRSWMLANERREHVGFSHELLSSLALPVALELSK